MLRSPGYGAIDAILLGADSSDTQVLFNDSSTVAGDAGLTYNKTTNTLTLTSGILSFDGTTLLRPAAAANLRHGAADAAAPVAQTLSVQNVVAGTTNTAGAAFTIAGSQGTGTGAGGAINLQIAPAGGSGSAQNALATAWQVSVAGHLLCPTDNTYDIGASGATRPRAAYIAGNVVVSGGTASVNSLAVTQNSTTAGILLSGGTNPQYRLTDDGTIIAKLQVVTGSLYASFGTESGHRLEINTNNTVRWQIGATTGHFLAGTDNTYDIGAAVATRPRNLHLGGYLAGAVQALSGAGAVNLTTWTTAFTSTGAGNALTLADGVVGQIKYIVHVVDGGSGVLTPTNLFNGTTITFTNLGDSCILQFIGTEWHVIALNGAALA